MLFWLLPFGWLGGLAPTARAQETADERPAAQAIPPPVCVMSFNLRYGNANDGENRWERRRDLLTQTIREFSPDLLGTQETIEAQKRWLDGQFPEYESWGVGRDDGQRRGEMTALWYRRERFERLDGGHFWLSEQPERPGSVSWDSSLTRMASWVKLKDRQHPNRIPLLFLNTHFDHRGEEARRQSARLIRDRLPRLGEGCDWIVTGDFNAAESSAAYKELFAPSNSALRDTYRLAFPERQQDEGTFNGFQVNATSGPRIDWIGISAAWKVDSAAIDRTEQNGRTPSDHFPVTAVISR